MKQALWIIAVVLVSVGCRPQWSGGSQNIPTPVVTPIVTGDVFGDGEFVEELAVVETVDALILESFPVQVNVVVTGYLADGCSEIGRVETAMETNTYTIELYTKRPEDAVCTQVIQEFEQSIPLDVQGLSAGEYTVSVNGKETEFTLDVDNVIEGQL